ncbi:protein Wnt-4-like [Homarus americanus]|uniref:protein Wnt-4-like n=1 Tax=Homarus americanus TaxID=6706 RepID=UPI001C4918FD|nr:protein Wnt-4-like [Homarus americanus]
MAPPPSWHFPVVVAILVSLAIIFPARGYEGVHVRVPPGYPKKYQKLPTSYQGGYVSRYPGYPTTWREPAPQYPQQHVGYLGNDNGYTGGHSRATDSYSQDTQNGYRINGLGGVRLSGNNIGYPMDTVPQIRYQQNPVVGYPNYGYPVIGSSPNDVINRTFVPPWDASVWDQPLDPDVCRTLAGLSRPQLHICTRTTDIAGAAAIGLGMAVRECRRQFANHRWNCTALLTPTNNPHTAAIMGRGYSESAFGHAITAAGVTHSVARACAAGRLYNCSCGMVRGKRAWKWSGCHDNTRFGARYSRKFLDVRERAKDMISFTHLYNNEVGRKVVRRNREVRCKCHGMSGSCEVRTCWKAAPDFRRVGDMLKKKYREAKSAAVEVFGNSANTARKYRPVRREISPDSPLLYVEKSPTFCDVDGRLDVAGTRGRHCNRTSTGPDSCDTLCCGRGYDQRRETATSKCHCRFKWCCKVSCHDCSVEKWISVCK